MTPCPLCGGASHPRLEARDVNRNLSEETFRYRECERCSAIFLENVPDDLGGFYPPAYYDLASDGAASATERAKLRIVTRHVSGGRLVEVGPGPGAFAAAARAAGFDVTGVEMDEGACRHLREDVGVAAVQSDHPAAALPALAPLDVLAAWHVIEHLRDPLGLVAAAAEALAPGGVLVVATPNPRALQLRLLGGRWTHVDAPRHLFLLPAPLLVETARGHGLELAELVSSDRTALDWNSFGWQRVLRPGRPPGALAAKAGAALGVALAPVELSGLRASAYTAVFTKPTT